MIPAPTLRERIVAEALTWRGTPYHHQGRVKGVGVDCIGLEIGVARALGLVASSFDISGYQRDPDGVTLKRLADSHLLPIDPRTLQPGDIAVSVLPKRRLPQHFGIIVPHPSGELGIVHAHGSEDGRGEVLMHRLSKALMHRVVLAYSFPGVH